MPELNEVIRFALLMIVVIAGAVIGWKYRKEPHGPKRVIVAVCFANGGAALFFATAIVIAWIQRLQEQQ